MKLHGYLGIDMGSTTVKSVLLNPDTDEILFSDYRRHEGAPKKALLSLFEKLNRDFSSYTFSVAFTGSQSSTFADIVGASYIQEVIAGAIMISKSYPQTATAIELGGQDAKILFFSKESGEVSDMRMNGVCAGGTGAFLDQTSALLNIPIEEFDSYAQRGGKIYEISGRCGVFAKTDIQPLLNQGIAREDIALSCLHALAKQTIGGLAQGMEILPSILFAGGPFHFIPKLKDVFIEQLNLSQDQFIYPENSQTLVATGAALALHTKLAKKSKRITAEGLIKALPDESGRVNLECSAPPLFKDRAEKEEFLKTHAQPEFSPIIPKHGETLPVYIGVDAGSTTTKFILLTEDREVAYRFYSNNGGEPLNTAKRGLLECYNFYKEHGVELKVLGFGSTGYGEHLFAKAFGGDYHTVETIAHKEAAAFFAPDVSFILDLGGQDMKAIFIRDSVITDIVLNEACSAGCGSFLESYARSLNIEPQNIAEHAFAATSPPALGSRCTVFMNSSIITEQKSGRTVEDILAGLCYSIVENLFTKVIRIQGPESLGNKIIVQGGTFKNDAVLKAFSDYVGLPVIRPPFSGEMGALGVALLTEKNTSKSKKSRFIGFDQLENLTYSTEEGNRCPFCANACQRSIIRFSNGAHFLTGNRCDRGEILDEKSHSVEAKRSSTKVTDLMREREKLLLSNWGKNHKAKPEKGSIGIPLVLDFYESLPFWKTLFSALGYRVIVSGKSSPSIYQKGAQHIPSDTACLPAKVVHGHILTLKERGAERVFFPQIKKSLKENKSSDDSWNCPVLVGYPEVIRISEFSHKSYSDIDLLSPSFRWENRSLRKKQTLRFLSETLDERGSAVEKAFKEADRALEKYRETLLEMGRDLCLELERGDTFGVVVSGRPYHGDMYINHGIADLFTSKGIPVLINEALPINSEDTTGSFDTYNPLHTRMIATAKLVSKTPFLEMVQVVSFGCGHDAVITDEIDKIIRENSEKALLALKVDEGENKGPLNIRITSFVETVKTRRRLTPAPKIRLQERIRGFKKSDRQREILFPNLSRAFSLLLCEAFAAQGYRTRVLPRANRDAINLGKRYVHNDICFPAQVNIGEHLAWLKANPEKAEQTAVMLAKNCSDCRAGHYANLARKALDANGFKDVPIITTDFNDKNNYQPGLAISEGAFRFFMLKGIVLIDALDDMVRKVRPYEKIKGGANELHEYWCNETLSTLRKSGWRSALQKLKEAVDAFNNFDIDRPSRRPRVGIIGEILVNFHETSNYGIVEYLEENGMEVVLPPLIEFWRQEVVNKSLMSERGHSRNGLYRKAESILTEKIYSRYINQVEKVLSRFKFYEPHADIRTIADKASSVFDLSFHAGEGWLIPGEILCWIERGIDSHLIVQPFGCLPNHISGRGAMKAIKTKHPEASLLAIDFDPDTSVANIHNRLQMIILNATKEDKDS